MRNSLTYWIEILIEEARKKHEFFQCKRETKHWLVVEATNHRSSFVITDAIDIPNVYEDRTKKALKAKPPVNLKLVFHRCNRKENWIHFNDMYRNRRRSKLKMVLFFLEQNNFFSLCFSSLAPNIIPASKLVWPLRLMLWFIYSLLKP